jgi:hypothetical protein
MEGWRDEGITPAHLPLVEHPFSHHVGPVPGGPLLEDLIVLAALAAFAALAFAPALEVGEPPLDAVTPVAQGVLGTGVVSGDNPSSDLLISAWTFPITSPLVQVLRRISGANRLPLSATYSHRLRQP